VVLAVCARDDRYLTGCRGDGNEHVYTKDPAKEPDLAASYQWRVQRDKKTIGEGSIRYDESPGAEIWLKCQSRDDRFLTGGRGEKNEGVYSKDGENGSVDETYSWLVKRKVD
jgi:hypothetical protein